MYFVVYDRAPTQLTLTLTLRHLQSSVWVRLSSLFSQSCRLLLQHLPSCDPRNSAWRRSLISSSITCHSAPVRYHCDIIFYIIVYAACCPRSQTADLYRIYILYAYIAQINLHWLLSAFSNAIVMLVTCNGMQIQDVKEGIRIMMSTVDVDVAMLPSVC